VEWNPLPKLPTRQPVAGTTEKPNQPALRQPGGPWVSSGFEFAEVPELAVAVERRIARLHRQEEKARWTAAVKAQQALDHLSGLLVQATLLTSGFHKHGGSWRKKRNGKRTDTTCEQVTGRTPGSPGEACPAGGRVRTA